MRKNLRIEVPNDLPDDQREGFIYGANTARGLLSQPTMENRSESFVTGYNLGFQAQTTAMTPPIVSVVQSIDVKAEMDRRQALGISISVDGVEHLFQSDPQSQAHIQGAVTLAQLALASDPTLATSTEWGKDGKTFSWITSDNTVVGLTPLDCINLGVVVADQVAHLLFAARTLKDMSPIPNDYTDDKYWV